MVLSGRKENLYMSIFDFFSRNPEFTDKEYSKKNEKEFKERTEEAPFIELQGFPGSEKAKYAGLTKTEKNKKIEEEKNKDGIVLDDEQMRIFLKDILEKVPSGVKEFLEKQCIVKLNKDSTEGNVAVSTPGDKIVIELDPKSFVEYGKTKIIDEEGIETRLTYFRPEKAAFLIGWAIGAVLQPPTDWKEKCRKVEIVQGRQGEWEDFVGLYLSNPEESRKVFPEAYELLRHRLENINEDESFQKIGAKRSFEKGDLSPDLRTAREKGNTVLGKIPKEDGANRRFMFNWMENYKTWRTTFQEAYWKRTNWYQRAVAEFEDKETSRIVKQNEGIVDRLKSFAQLVGDGIHNPSWEDQFLLRTLILSAMETGDFGLTIIHSYLQSCDKLYRKSHGEFISEESYNFVVRLHRISNDKKRLGTKPTEYRKVEPGEEYVTYQNGKPVTTKATERIYVRKGREEYQEQVLEENMSVSNRDVNNIAKEALENLKTDGRYISVGGKNWEFVGQPFENKESNKYMVANGDERVFVGKDFADLKYANMNHRELIAKMDPDQIAYLARIYAEQIKVRAGKIGLPISSKDTLGEHAKTILVAAYNHYMDAFLTDPKLRSYVNYCLASVNLELTESGRYDFEEKYSFDYIKNPGAKDEEKIEQYIERFQIKKAGKDEGDIEMKETLDTAHKFEKEFETEPSQEDLEDSLDKMLVDEEPGKTTKKFKSLDKAIKHYENLIKEKIKSSLPLEIQATVESTLFDKELSQQEFIFEEMEENLETAMGLEGKGLPLEIRRKLQAFNTAIRPVRREYIKLDKLKNDLGIETIVKKVQKNADEKTIPAKNYQSWKVEENLKEIETEEKILSADQINIKHQAEALVESIKKTKPEIIKKLNIDVTILEKCGSENDLKGYKKYLNELRQKASILYSFEKDKKTFADFVQRVISDQADNQSIENALLDHGYSVELVRSLKNENGTFKKNKVDAALKKIEIAYDLAADQPINKPGDAKAEKTKKEEEDKNQKEEEKNRKAEEDQYR